MLRNTERRAAAEHALPVAVMAEPRASIARWRISDLLLDTRRQRVWRGDEEIPLPRLTYALFVALVRRCPDVVSDEELMKVVWPGVIVNLETVSQRVKLLRQSLQDDPRSPRYVGRLRSRGYHLVPTAVPVSDEEQGLIESHFGDTGTAGYESELWAANPAARDAVISMLSSRPGEGHDVHTTHDSVAANGLEAVNDLEAVSGLEEVNGLEATNDLEATHELVAVTELFPPYTAAANSSARSSLIVRLRALVTHIRRR